MCDVFGCTICRLRAKISQRILPFVLGQVQRNRMERNAAPRRALRFENRRNNNYPSSRVRVCGIRGTYARATRRVSTRVYRRLKVKNYAFGNFPAAIYHNIGNGDRKRVLRYRYRCELRWLRPIPRSRSFRGSRKKSERVFSGNLDDASTT